MSKRKHLRVKKNSVAQQRARLSRHRHRIAAEMPQLVARDQMRKEASEEPTLSGELRRAIHSSPLSLSDIASHAKLSRIALDEFLTGERTLRSDVLDRLASQLGLVLSPQQ